MFKKIAAWPFWAHLLMVIGLTVGIILSILGLLGKITDHGSYKIVPNVLGLDTRTTMKKLEGSGYSVSILDSTYCDTLPFGVILKQYPDPNSQVKANRTILLTMNRYALPLVDVPALEGKSINFAIDLLQRHHLKLGDTVTQPDFMRGSVLQQKLRGQPIAPGAKVPWGTPIDMIIGSGLGDEDMVVPDFVGMNFSYAKDSLTRMGVLLGAIVCDPNVIDTANAFVWRQMPPHLNEEKQVVFIKSGQLMDVWLSVTPKLDSAALHLKSPNEANTNKRPKKSNGAKANANNPD